MGDRGAGKRLTTGLCAVARQWRTATDFTSDRDDSVFSTTFVHLPIYPNWSLSSILATPGPNFAVVTAHSDCHPVCTHSTNSLLSNPCMHACIFPDHEEYFFEPLSSVCIVVCGLSYRDVECNYLSAFCSTTNITSTPTPGYTQLKQLP